MAFENIDKVTTVFIDATNIQGSAGIFYEIISSASRAIRQVQAFDTSGKFIGLYTGNSGQEVLEFIIGPGADTTIPIIIPTGTRISLKSLEATAPTSGYVGINFLG